MSTLIRIGSIIVIVLSGLAQVRGQNGEPLRVQGGLPGGLRNSATEAFGVYEFSITNDSSSDRDARILVLFPSQSDLQYGRDLWVPAQSTLESWVPVGPVPRRGAQLSREVQSLLYDRTGGQERLILPAGEERVRSRLIFYREREPTTSILLDTPNVDREYRDPPYRPADPTPVALTLTRTFRLAHGLSQYVSVIGPGFLPPTPAAYDGIDHFVLASDRLKDDLPGRTALRHWVQQGGKLWIMLDQVSTQTVAAIFGDDLGFQEVDRVGLNTIRMDRNPPTPRPISVVELEEPATLVRVLPNANDRVLFTVGGWPAAFMRPLGRGEVLVTTLSGPAWYRPRTAADRPSGFPDYPNVPVPLDSLRDLARELRPQEPPPAFTVQDLRPLLSEEIGYEVPSLPMAAFVFGGFMLGVIGVGTVLRRTRRPELAGWLGPVAAVLAAGVFVTLGLTSRQAVPPTDAAIAIAAAAPGTDEAAVHGLYALYRPESGENPLGTKENALLNLDDSGLDGQVRRRIQTDIGAWHWENLSLPAGVRSGPFQFVARGGRLAATARFTSTGLSGKFDTGPFQNAADALILTPAKLPLAVRFQPDGSFSATTSDLLAPGQYLAGTVLTDRQQRRQNVYRRLLDRQMSEQKENLELPMHEFLEGRDLLLAWTEISSLPFDVIDGSRKVGSALTIVPLALERAAPGRVTVPAAFIPFRRVADGGLRQPLLESAYPVDMRLRFQLPPSVLPMNLERATLLAKVRTPGRGIKISGYDGERLVPLSETNSPVEPIRIEIADPRLLKLDADGGLHIQVKIDGGNDPHWIIEQLALDVVGQVTVN